MLSSKAFHSLSNAHKYYSHEDYYGSEAKGEWFGEGANELALVGEFEAKNSQMFRDVLEGKLSDGVQLGRREKDNVINHRPGIDLTFSSPKSFSIQMLVFADKDEKIKLEQARQNAVHNTLSYIVKSGLVYARKGNAGIEQEIVNKLTFALFTHTTNRNLEPQDHVHCLLANMAKCSDGKYRSIVWDNIFENNKFIGQVFRNELALETTKLGYEIDTRLLPDGSSSFELKNIPQNLIDAFSTRRKEIEALCKKFGVKTKEGRDRIVINSRKTKKTINKENLEQAWKKVVESVEIERNLNKTKDGSITEIATMTVTGALEKIRDFLAEKFSTRSEYESILELNPDNLAKLCLDDLSHHNSVFTKHDLSAKALKYSLGKYRISDVESSINKLIDKKEIIAGKDNLLTSRELLDKEQFIIKTGKDGLNKHTPLIEKSIFQKRFELNEKHSNRKHLLNEQQVKAVRHVLTSKDKITAIQGLPGVGKSTVLDTVRQMSRQNIIDLIGTAPTASAAKTLQDSAGIPSSTLHSFVSKYKGYLENRGTIEGKLKTQNEFSKTIVFVDEASLISTCMMYNLLKLADIMKFRIVLIGDTKQLPAVEAGKPFEQLLDVIKSAKLTTILRQKDDHHKEAIKAVVNNRFLDCYRIHNRNIKEAGDRLVPQAVAEYTSLTKTERDNTLLISPTRVHRDEINRLIVDQLKKEGNIAGNIYNHQILKQKDVTKADHNFAKSYEVGNIVKFHVDYKSSNIKRGEYLEVKKVNELTNTITFRKGIKNIIFHLKSTSDYESKLEIFKKDTLELQAGLKLRITKNDKDNNFTNSETVIVDNINRNKNQITLKLEDNTKRTMPIDQLKHVDYGYCSTIHSSQGKTTDKLIAAISSHNKLNNQKSWLVAISRHRQDISIYAENKGELQNQIVKNIGEVKSALDIKQERNNDNIRNNNDHNYCRIRELDNS
jgi:conjugative relaxase-like TrwC/TraI family protein